MPRKLLGREMTPEWHPEPRWDLELIQVGTTGDRGKDNGRAAAGGRTAMALKAN